MAAIYDKSLRRKDYSGIVNKEKEEEVTDHTSNEEVNKRNSKSTVSFFLIVSNLIRTRKNEGEKAISDGEGRNR
jgi:hypothetical protein